MGYPRTGTTFIQKEILPNFGSVQALAKPYKNILEGGSSFGTFGRFFQRSPRIWEAWGEDLFLSLFGSPDEQKTAPDVLISDESVGIDLARHCSYAGSASFVEGSRSAFSRSENYPIQIPHLRELSRLVRQWGFTRVRALVVIRRQDTWVPSAYVKESNHREDPCQTDFQEHVRSLIDPHRRLYEDGVVLDYHAVACGLSRALGEENVMVLPYEMMREDPADFFSRWANFLGLSEADTTQLQFLIEQSSPEVRNARSLPEDRWAISPDGTEEDECVKLTESLRQKLLATFRDSNQKLDCEVKYDMKIYGYY